MAEHSTRNLSYGVRLCSLGYEANFLDLSGYGYSSGKRCLSTLKELIQDIELVLRNLRTDLPLFVIGHSMGGGILMSMLRLNPNLNISGVILSNPFIDFHPKEEISKLEKFGINLLPNRLMVI